MTTAERKTEQGHTPGPWKAGYYSSVVGLPVAAQPDPKENTIIVCGVRGSRETAEANARLIAAAPDLLAALEGIADFANTMAADLAADIQAGRPLTPSINDEIAKWSAVGSAIFLARNGGDHV